MLAAMRDQVEAQVPLAALVVGDGPLMRRMQEELESRGLAGWVTLTGGLDRTEIRELCRSADLYVAPATRESFGIAALEARAAGLPVVAMRSGGVRDFVRDGIEGLLADDDAEMASALAALARNQLQRTRMAHHNRSVAPLADWPVVAAGFDLVYDAAAGREAQPSAGTHHQELWRVVAP
jgi:glycosyltransferase involved in cell wall biosynthesis